jgi:hypothetical protein
MSRIEYRGDLQDVVRAVLQLVTNRAKAGRPPELGTAAALVPEVLSLLRVGGSTMTEESAETILGDAGDYVVEVGSGEVLLKNEHFTAEQLEAIAFLMRNAPRRLISRC